MGRGERVDPRPCYFNAGCCCFVDAKITGIEIADGDIRLVRWPDDNYRPNRKILQESTLWNVFEGLGRG